MSLSDQPTASEVQDLGGSAREFLNYCNAERERRLNSGDDFNQEAFDEAVELVLRRLRTLAEEGWT